LVIKVRPDYIGGGMEMANHKTELLYILVAIVTVLSLCALCTPANAGVSPDVGRDIYPGDSIIIGETNLNFFNATGGSISAGVILSNWENSNIVIPFSGSFDSSRYDDELVPGEYIIVVIVIDKEGNAEYVIESYMFFISPKLEVTATVNGEDFDWVTRGGDILFEMDTNMWIIDGLQPNYITYKLLDPSGESVQLFDITGVPVTYIDVSEGDVIFSMLNTAGMRTGVYTLSIKSDPDTNNGLDVEGNETSFEVRSNGVTIEASEETQTVTEDIVFTVYTTPHTTVTVDVTWGRESKVKFGAGGTSALGLSDEDGEFKTSAVFADTGAYEITATEDIMGTTDSIFVEIVPYKTELDVDKDPPIYHIGENVKITGSATAGSKITLKIEDNVVARELDVDGFDYTWQTEDKKPGSYKIAIWVEGEGSPFSDPFQDPPDASLSLVLIRGGLIATPSAEFVALGDKFTIKGIVPGRDYVDILTIAPDGGGGRGFDPDDISDDTGVDVPGLTYETTGVDTDGEFETEDITVGEDVDTGTYLIAALNYGRDGVWGKSRSRNDDLLNVTSNNNIAVLGAKTTDQLLAMLKDKTINAAGTDDLLGIATISVEKGFVTLDELEDVPLGKKIEITGTTNRQEDTPLIVTVEGLEETTPKLKPRIAEVKEDDKTFYNTFSISVDTKSTNIGTYEVTADDGDGHTASTTVTILPAEEHSVTVSTTPTPKTEDQEPETGEEAEKPPTKTTTPTPTPTEEPAEQPGFGMPLCIAGLLLTVVVLLRRRNKR
jgi:hypothetical protein